MMNAIEPALEIVQLRSTEFTVCEEQLKSWLCLSRKRAMPRSPQLVAKCLTLAPEIALARTAALPPISAAADVLVLGRRGYESAVKGANGFVWFVERWWTAGLDDPQFHQGI